MSRLNGTVMARAADRLAAELSDYNPHDNDWWMLCAELADASIHLASSGLLHAGDEDAGENAPEVQLRAAAYHPLRRLAWLNTNGPREVVPPQFDGPIAECAEVITLNSDDEFNVWLAERSCFLLFQELDREDTTGAE